MRCPLRTSVLLCFAFVRAYRWSFILSLRCCKLGLNIIWAARLNSRKLELDSFLLLSSSVSTFGAVLDMVTDRVSTACLLVILSQVFLSLLALDIASHWLQMYSHKDVKDSTSWLFRLYYGNRIFMCYCCVSCEVLYIILLLIANNQTENLLNVVVATLTHIITTLFSTGFDFVGLVDETDRQYHSDENSCRCMCSV
ncbi:hypothetical protein DY000_02063274 [Brassica cretica]|uniref:CDP-diacylglycerol--inositol 3-phosphatidyltransferase n=1 Tax=Brassica cretica TaxID=69181 RepID=A0ABQ7ASN7_BRACR|nr:hypothetical protein DY000_02063274 [Brassica cretica]